MHIRPAILLSLAWSLGAQPPSPTFADVPYGPHSRNVLDFWQARSAKPAPVIVGFHGGGFVEGDKLLYRGSDLVKRSVEAGISFAAVNYRLLTDAPIHEILRDFARAVQYIRSRSAEWNIDKRLIAAEGGSAGAGGALWVAFRDDLADPTNRDPILRESTRLAAAAASAPQFSYDIVRMRDAFGLPDAGWIQDYVKTFYRLAKLEELLSTRVSAIRAEVDIHSLITPDDPPVWLFSPGPAGTARDPDAFAHHPKHAILLKRRCDEAGVKAELHVPAVDARTPAPDAKFRFLRHCLTAGCSVDARPLSPQAEAVLAAKPEMAPRKFLPPTYRDVAYGPHRRNTLDLWKATSDKPTPVVVWIHGGGFTEGDKEWMGGPNEAISSAGISTAAVNYRLLADAPVHEILRDVARAVQYLRLRAPEWRIDPTRIAVCGHSSGGSAALWLAFHDDLANPRSADPVLHQSSRVVAAAAGHPQFTLDLLQWPDIFGSAARPRVDPAHLVRFFGLSGIDWISTDAGKALRSDVDIRGLITADDPPVYLFSNQPASTAELGHHPQHVVLLNERCREKGVKSAAYVPAIDGKPQPSAGMFGFIREVLTGDR